MKNKNLLIPIVLMGVIFFSFSLAAARVTGPCNNCHTMHASQTPWPTNWGDAGNLPKAALLVGDCVGCHSADTGVTKTLGSSTVPVVWTTGGAPTYTTTGLVAGVGQVLAGGNFYWADAVDDAKGHNVLDESIGSTTFTEPPGYNAAYPTPARPDPWVMASFSCGGTYGCHGDPTQTGSAAGLSGAHHGDDACVKLATYDDDEAGTTVSKSYRFLLGIKGIEDPVWESNASPTLGTNHNVYKGEDRTTDARSDTSTISYLCAECHGDFHGGTGDLGMDADAAFGAPWLRHPTDYDMGNVSTKEYGDYGAPGSADHTYSSIAPVAWVTLTASMVTTPVTFADDTVVTCISCHRAHGTPNDDILRWDYALMDAGSDADPRNNVGGCFICHTTK
jgi:cytochrome c553